MKRSPLTLRDRYRLKKVWWLVSQITKQRVSLCVGRQMLDTFIAFILCFVPVLFAGPVFAAADVNINVQGLSAESMLVHIAQQVPNLMRFVTAFAYVFGMYLIIHGVIRMKHFGEMRTMMSHEHSVMGPIVMLAVGTLLLYLPTSVQVGVSTFWAEPNPYGYVQQGNQWQDFINVCYTIIQLIGTIAFVRGLIILSHVGRGGGGHQGGMAKGMTHVVGGILCINIYQFVQVMTSTLGLSYS